MWEGKQLSGLSALQGAHPWDTHRYSGRRANDHKEHNFHLIRARFAIVKRQTGSRSGPN